MLSKVIYKVLNGIYRGFVKVIYSPGKMQSFGACGKNVRISYDFDTRGDENIYIGNNCQIGPHSLFWTTKAKIIIKDNVLMGPCITIITGDHKTNVIGKCIIDVGDNEKEKEYDQDVIIESDTWIGANVTILKGVTIGKGCVIAAGSVVTKDTLPYSVYVGCPAHKVKDRFSQEELEQHLKIIKDAENE